MKTPQFDRRLNELERVAHSNNRGQVQLIWMGGVPRFVDSKGHSWERPATLVWDHVFGLLKG